MAAEKHVAPKCAVTTDAIENTFLNPSIITAKKNSMLPENHVNEPNLIISYLPNLTSASQPRRGARRDPTISDIAVKVGGTKIDV